MVIAASASLIVPWALFGLLLVGVLAYTIYRLKNRPKGLAQIKANLKASEAKVAKQHAEIKAAAIDLKVAERIKAEAEVKLLEAQHSDKLKALDTKERDEYEKAKDDPESGVDHMRKLLGLGS